MKKQNMKNVFQNIVMFVLVVVVPIVIAIVLPHFTDNVVTQIAVPSVAFIGAVSAVFLLATDDDE